MTRHRHVWLSSPLRVLGRVLGIGFAVAFVTSEVIFIFAKPVCETLYPLKGMPTGGGTTNLAFFEYGPTVRVSSINFFDRHHSGYLIDGVTHSPDQKWMSDPKDRHPWLEIRFRGAHSLAAVRLTHAGVMLTARAYTITCLRNKELSAIKVVIEGTNEARPLHPIPCPQATGIRIDFPLRGADAIRLYEVEALGLW